MANQNKSQNNSSTETSPPVENVSELCQKLHVATANLVRQSNKLPMLGDGHELYSSFAEYAEFMRVQRNRALILLRRLTNYQCRLNESVLNDGMGPLIGFCDALIDRAAIALDEHQRSLMQDRIKARQISLGAEQIGKNTATTAIESTIASASIVKPGSAADAFRRNSNGSGTFRDGGGRFAVFATHSEMATTAKLPVAVTGQGPTILKPQRAFRELINNSDLPFVPKLRFKHNAIAVSAIAAGSSVSVGRGGGKMRLMLAGGDEAIEENGRDEQRWGGEGTAREWPSDAQADESGRMSLANETIAEDEAAAQHPYAEELTQFEPNEQTMALPEIVNESIPLGISPLIWVRQLKDLEALVDTLNGVHEFAFDVEHHSLHSFLGLTCLLQISTRSADYLVDPFPLWSHMHLLNDPFTNPNIVKVAFSADSDVLWLQRDFGIYVVGLFDCRLGSAWLRRNTNDGNNCNNTNGGGGSLAQMVADLLDVHLDKQFQMADWRQRPLNEQMVNYARSDTHFLLHCYDRLKLDLSKHWSHNDTARSALCEVFMQSTQICLLVYKQNRFNPMGHMKLLRRGRRRFNNRQLDALARLWAWRDRTARQLDESLNFVLPEHMMLQIAETLPREPSGIFACCVPVPPIVRSEQSALHKIICRARDLPLETPAASSAVAVRERNADEMLVEFDANRITAQRAKLELRIDLSRAYKSMLTMTTTDESAANERQGEEEITTGRRSIAHETMRKLIEIANRTDGAKDKRTNATKENEQTGRKGCASAIRTVVLIDDGEDDEQRGNGQKHREETERRKDQIRNRIEHEWVSPYDNYVLTARQKTPIKTENRWEHSNGANGKRTDATEEDEQTGGKCCVSAEFKKSSGKRKNEVQTIVLSDDGEDCDNDNEPREKRRKSDKKQRQSNDFVVL